MGRRDEQGVLQDVLGFVLAGERDLSSLPLDETSAHWCWGSIFSVRRGGNGTNGNNQRRRFCLEYFVLADEFSFALLPSVFPFPLSLCAARNIPFQVGSSST